MIDLSKVICAFSVPSSCLNFFLSVFFFFNHLTMMSLSVVFFVFTLLESSASVLLYLSSALQNFLYHMPILILCLLSLWESSCMYFSPLHYFHTCLMLYYDFLFTFLSKLQFGYFLITYLQVPTCSSSLWILYFVVLKCYFGSFYRFTYIVIFYYMLDILVKGIVEALDDMFHQQRFPV